MASNISQIWNSFWYEPNASLASSPLRLGISRAVAVSIILWNHIGTNFESMGTIDPSMYIPIGLFSGLGLSIPSSTTLSVLTLIWKLSLVSFCLGFKTRLSGAIAFTLSLYLLGLVNCFGKVFHRDNATPFVLLVLAMSNCGTRFSLDSLIARRKGESLSQSNPTEYIWPFRLLWAYFGLVFFAAGYAKISASGMQWIVSEHMSRVLISHSLNWGTTPNELGLFIASSPMLCMFFAAGTILLETASPLVLVSVWARRLIPLGIFSMFMGFEVLLGFSLHGFYPLFTFFVPWDIIYSKGLKVANEII